MPGSGDEAGFSLIELLVVMLILGILAAVALPSFFDQQTKAGDAKAKELAHTVQVTMETCGSDADGSYKKCTLAALQEIEPSIPESETVKVNKAAATYTIKVTADSENTFSIVRDAEGEITYPCTVSSSNRGGCPGTAKKKGNWD